MKLPRPSLFARLLWLQVGVALALLVVFAGLVYVERNVAVARLVADRWAPALREAAGWSGTVPGTPPAVVRSAQRPPMALRSFTSSPRMAALEDELRQRGVPLQEVVIARGLRAPTVWLLVAAPDGAAPVWLGFSDVALLPSVPRRLLLALVIAGLLLVGFSWAFTRRLTRPLEHLRARMASQRPGEPRAAAAPLADASPEIASIAAAYDDLLARFEAHERERALLLAGVSHDLRSPLARIRLAAGLLPDDPALAARRESIVRNTQVADRLIESFLDHVRAGELALDQRADLAVLARTAVEARARDATDLACNAPGSLPVENTHPLLLERLLANLLDNALQHGRAPVRLALHTDGTTAVIEVSDHGPGLPEGRRDELLQAFARGDASRQAPGTGLGLAIVARIVSRLRGTLNFEHAQGVHTVCVRLPLTGAASSALRR
jgi:two-component system, OmpR family, osmolarity sensor histidine kinase EnvZ